MSVIRDSRPTSTVKLTYDGYVLFPEDGNRHEIIDGQHYMNAAPVPRHQLVVARLMVQLFEQIPEPGFGMVFPAPVDVQLSEHDVVQPDIIVVLTNNSVVQETRIVGTPDLVVEVLSASTRRRDETLKRQLYEQYQVPEYWIVDPDAHIVQQLRLAEDRTFEKALQTTETIIYGAVPNGALIDLTRVW